MANIDKLIIKDPSASEPTNPLEMYVAKINGTYTGDIPEPTNDLEKALARVAAKPSPAPGGNGWAKAKIYNEYYDRLSVTYVGPDGWHMEVIPLDPENPVEITAVSPYSDPYDPDNRYLRAHMEVIVMLPSDPGARYAQTITDAELFDNNERRGNASDNIIDEYYDSGLFIFRVDYNYVLDQEELFDPENMCYKIEFFKSGK